MNKIISFFRESSPIKLILIIIVISVISCLIEKPLPNIFMGLRLIAFILFVYGTIRFLNRR